MNKKLVGVAITFTLVCLNGVVIVFDREPGVRVLAVLFGATCLVGLMAYLNGYVNDR